MRRNQFFWGLVAVTAGVLLLLQNLGILTFSFWPIFWGILLILLGIWFLIGPKFFRAAVKKDKLYIPLGSEPNTEITLNHGAGRIEVHALELSGNLLEGSFSGGVDHSKSTDGTTMRLSLQPSKDAFNVPPFPDFASMEWDLGLARDIPLKLWVKTGASDNYLDLSDLQINYLKLETGASSTRIILPGKAGFTRAEIQTGAASVEVSIPGGVSASIMVESGLSGLNINSRRFPQSGNLYRSPDYDTAVNRIELLIRSGVGSVSVN